DDERVHASIERYTLVITQRGGEVDQPNIWGKRRLAYEIDGENDGIYVLLLYKAGADVNAELERLMRIDENVLRHLLVVRPLPNPPKPVTVPEGAAHPEGPRSMPTPAAEGSVPLPRPRGAQPAAEEAAQETAGEQLPSDAQAEPTPEPEVEQADATVAP
ncbi:Ribosomal protein S6, partial [mine drainage metagenome]